MPLEKYFLLQNGTTFGPYSLKRIEDMLRAGEATLDTVCLLEGGARIQRLRELFPNFREADLQEETDLEPERDDPVASDDPPAEANESAPNDLDETVDWEDGIWIAEEEDDDFGEEADDAQTDGDDPEIDPDKVLLMLHPALISYVKLMVTTTLLFTAAGALLWAGMQDDRGTWFGLAAAFGFLGAVVLSWTLFIRHRSVYVVTRSRVEALWGIFSKSSKEVRVVDIRRIDVEKKGALGILGVGTVLFASAGTDGFDIDFRNVWRPHRVTRVVRQIRRTPGLSKQALLRRYFGE